MIFFTGVWLRIWMLVREVYLDGGPRAVFRERDPFVCNVIGVGIWPPVNIHYRHRSIN